MLQRKCLRDKTAHRPPQHIYGREPQSLDYTCDVGPSGGTCKALPGDGQPCASGMQCKEGLICRPDNTCGSALVDGAGCKYEFQVLRYAFRNQIMPHIDQTLAERVLEMRWFAEPAARAAVR